MHLENRRSLLLLPGSRIFYFSWTSNSFVIAFKFMASNEEPSSYPDLHFTAINICRNWNFSVDVEMNFLTFRNFVPIL